VDWALGARRDPPDTVAAAVAAPVHPHLLWVEECLRHLSSHAQAITGPALLMAEQRRLPWWR